MERENQFLSSHAWIAILKQGIVADDAEDEVLLAFLKHLADLGILASQEGDQWGLAQSQRINSDMDSREELSRQLHSLDPNEEGFIVKYFLSPDKFSSLKEPSASENKFPPKHEPRRKASSDLSNLQIVKKMGRQLSPFIEFEKEIIGRVEGVHVKKDDAKLIFKFIMSKVRDKEKPREWEQLSRKRHK